MKLAVLGSSPSAVVAAAWASATAGTAVIHPIDGIPGSWPVPVEWDGKSVPAQVDRVPIGSPIEADAFLLIAQRDELMVLARMHTESMRGKPVLVAPGGFAIVETIDEILNSGGSSDSLLGQIPGLPVTGDVDLAKVRIRAIKRNFPVGQLREGDSSKFVKTYQKWFPDLTASTIAETTLGNVNNIIHPSIILANAARSDNGEGYLFYRHGVSDGVSLLINRIDEDRLEIIKALNRESPTITESFKRYYGDQGLVGDDVGQMLSGLPTLSDSRGPATLNHRYINEDVVYGLAPMEELARRLDVSTPHLSSLITLLSVLSGSNLRESASRLVDISSICTIGSR